MLAEFLQHLVHTLPTHWCSRWLGGRELCHGFITCDVIDTHARTLTRTVVGGWCTVERMQVSSSQPLSPSQLITVLLCASLLSPGIYPSIFLSNFSGIGFCLKSYFVYSCYCIPYFHVLAVCLLQPRKNYCAHEHNVSIYVYITVAVPMWRPLKIALLHNKVSFLTENYLQL